MRNWMRLRSGKSAGWPGSPPRGRRDSGCTVPSLGARAGLRRDLLALLAMASAFAFAAEGDSLIHPRFNLVPEAPEWRELTAQFARRPDQVADFEEQRFFPFRKEPIVVKGEVRVSPQRGLSLHYTAPDERIIIIDDRGMLLREPKGKESPPPDPRATLANEALRHILRFDFAALAPNFELFGQRERVAWSLALVPRTATVRRAIGNIFVQGEGDFVRRIELHKSAKQHIDIVMAPPRPAAAFTAEEIQRYFR